MIEPSTAPALRALHVDDPVPLEQRVRGAGGGTHLSIQQALLEQVSGGNLHLFEFIGQYRDANGQRPYATPGRQLDMLQNVLQDLKAQGLEQSAPYQQIYQVFTTVFGINGFLGEFRRQVFDPHTTAEQQEASQW